MPIPRTPSERAGPVARRRSPRMLPQMPPTLCHSMRHARATADTVQRTAIHAAQSSNGLVKRDLGRAHGTDSTRTPCSGHLTRAGAYSR